MIDINLIPLVLRKDSKGNANAVAINIPQEVVVGVGFGLILIMLTVHLILGAVWLAGISRMTIINTRWQKVVPTKTLYDSINKESGSLKKKIKMISDMTIRKEVLWSPKFNDISDVLPKGLWLRRMSLDKVGLTMEGSVVSKSQNEIKDVGIFLSALKQKDEFMKDFSSLEVNSIQRGKSNAVDVTDFTVMAKLK